MEIRPKTLGIVLIIVLGVFVLSLSLFFMQQEKVWRNCEQFITQEIEKRHPGKQVGSILPGDGDSSAILFTTSVTDQSGNIAKVDGTAFLGRGGCISVVFVKNSGE